MQLIISQTRPSHSSKQSNHTLCICWHMHFSRWFKYTKNLHISLQKIMTIFYISYLCYYIEFMTGTFRYMSIYHTIVVAYSCSFSCRHYSLDLLTLSLHTVICNTETVRGSWWGYCSHFPLNVFLNVHCPLNL